MTEILDASQVNVARILNPFDPREHEREVVPWREGLTVAALFPPGEREHIVSVNGRPIPIEEQGDTYLLRGDCVVTCPVLQGGADDKPIFGMLAMIAVSVFTAGWGASIAGALGMGSFGASMIQAGIMMAGAMLVNSIFAPPKPSAPELSAQDTSPTYGIDGAKNTSAEGIPVPVCYGRFRMAGNIIALHVDNVGDTQVLYMLLNAGEGRVAGLGDVKINGNPIAEYQGAEVDYRLGTNEQEAIPWFDDTLTPHSIGVKLTTDWTPYTTNGEVDRLRFDFVAPNGLFRLDERTGDLHPWQVPVEVEYKIVGTSGWTSLLSNDLLPGDSGEATVSGGMTLRGARRSAVRYSIGTGQLISNRYDVRVRRRDAPTGDRTVSEDVFISDINEVILAPLAYPNTALVALKIRLSDQLSGLPEVSFINEGKLVPVYSPGSGFAEAASRNPAWVVWDILTNTRYGGAMPYGRLDLPAFQRWADHCDAEGLEWNGPIDTELNVWDATQLPLRIGRAQLVNVGTRWTVVVERTTVPSMMFSVANMVEGSYKETWLPMTDRANEVDVTFFDSANDYKQRTLKVYDPAALVAGQKQRNSAVTLYGCTDYAKAYKEAMFMLNLNRFILKTVTFQAPLESIACTVGDVIYVQHDMPAWAQAGRLEAGSTNFVLNLDRPVTISSDRDYQVLVHFDTFTRHTGAVQSIVGNTLYFSSNFGPAKRVSINGMDRAVVNQGPNWVEVESTAGMSAGQVAVLIDTDVIEERNVNAFPSGETTTLTLTSSLTSAPAQFTHWMFGETTKVKQTFRVKAITGGSSDYNREIVAIQYDPQIYGYGRFSGTGPVIDPTNIVISHVRSLDLYEQSRIEGNVIRTQLVASWNTPLSGRYAGADVFVSYNGGPLSLMGAVPNRTDVSIPANRGDTVKVKIVAFDILGRRAPFNTAPEDEHKVVGELQNVDPGDVTGADVIWSGRDCRLNWRFNSANHSYEFGSEPVGGDAGSMGPAFKDFEVQVFDFNDDVVLSRPRRVEYTATNSYFYTFEKNEADGLTRKLKFMIRVRDIFNNLGAPAVITAYNPPPRLRNLGVAPFFEGVVITYNHTDDTDFAGAYVWVSENAADIEGAPFNATMMQHLVYNGPNTQITVNGLMFDFDHYLRIGLYDVFGTTDIILSPVMPFRTTKLNIAAIAEGVLSESVLIPSLQDRINLIDGPFDMAGSVANRILGETNARNAAIAAERDARVEGDVAVANALDVVAVRMDKNEAYVLEESRARADGDTALASQISVVAATASKSRTYLQTEEPSGTLYEGDIWIDSDDDNRMYRWDGTAWIPASDARIEESLAAIANEAIARASADEAQASQINTLTTTVNDSTATIQTFQTSIDGLEAQYTVKIDINGYVAGFGLASTANNGVPTSEFIVRADKFAMIMPGYPGVYPFTIGAVNGVPRVIISSALIGDAAINTAKIGNLQVTNAKIADAAITRAKIGTAEIDTLLLRGDAVTVPGSAYAEDTFFTQGGAWGGSNWLTALTSPTIDPQGGTIIVHVNLMTWDPDRVSFGGGAVGPLYVRVVRSDGAIVIPAYEFGGGGVQFPIALQYLEPPRNGGVYFMVQVTSVGGPNNAWVGRRSISTIGAKR